MKKMKKMKNLALVAILGGFVMANAADLKNATSSQELVKAGSLGGFENNEQFFTGKVKVSYLFQNAPYRPFGGALVEFSKGARTAWRTHPAGQTLIVTDGVIITATEQGVSRSLQIST